jgi:hypothetical protein
MTYYFKEVARFRLCREESELFFQCCMYVYISGVRVSRSELHTRDCAACGAWHGNTSEQITWHVI